MDEILFDVVGAVGRVTLNRPKALNALTLGMTRELDARLIDWAADDRIAMVVVEGAGDRAFCAGGDIRALYTSLTTPGDRFSATFYREEYMLNHRIHAYPKPYVALIDGVVMGGGVGVSVHGSHRVVTENVLFAMPETGIGLFPDVGATHFLPRMPGALGMYLGLTGARLRAADVMYTGVGTHYVPQARLSELVEALLTGPLDDCLADFTEDAGAPPLAEHRAIDRCFAGATIEAIIAALKAEGTEWAEAALATLATKSPTSLKVTVRQLGEGAALDFPAAMRLEYRLSQRFCAGHDFAEGIRSVVIDKDNAPQWQPANLADLTEADVDTHFQSPPDGDLVL